VSNYSTIYRSWILYFVWPLKQQFEKLLFYKPRFWKKIDEWLVGKLTDLIFVEIWSHESLGWFRYKKTVTLANWIKENRLDWTDYSLVRSYFWGNWLVWDDLRTLPQPIVRDADSLVGQLHPLDLISLFSDWRIE